MKAIDNKKKALLIASVVMFVAATPMLAYAQTPTQSDMGGNIVLGIQAVTGLAIAIGGAIAAVVALAQGFQGKNDHNSNASRLTQVENIIKGYDQKFIDQATAFQQTLQTHKDDILLLIHFGLEYNPALAAYLQQNNLTVQALITKIQNGQIDVTQLKQILQNLTPPSAAPATTSTPPTTH